jgi:hypothetical protein
MKDERIIKYVENEMSANERSAFEAEVNNSVELKKELLKFMRVRNETEQLKNLRLNSLYLDTVLPEFRNRLEASKSFTVRRSLGYAFGVMLIFVISIFIMRNLFITESRLDEIEQFTDSLNENQRIELLENLNGEAEIYNYIPENISEAGIADLFASGLELNIEIAEAYDISYNDLIVGLSQAEIEKVYNEILNRNF